MRFRKKFRLIIAFLLMLSLSLMITLPAVYVQAAAPTVISVSINSGLQGQTISNVVITGTSFTGASAAGFGAGITVNSYSIDSDTQITANITISAAAVPGTRDVSVTTPEGTGTLPGGFTVTQAPPTVISVLPNSGTQGQTSLTVVINGTYFNNNNASAVSFGAGITVNSFTVDSAIKITANITIAAAATLGTRSVSVTTPGGTGTLAGAFTVLQATPIVTSVYPSSGSQGQTLTSVIIAGIYFNNASAVSFGAGITTNSFTVINNNQIAASITIDLAATLGTRNVSVTGPGGTGTLAGAFTVVLPPPPPAITSVSPSSGLQGQTLNAVVINGSSFTNTSVVSFGAEITVNSFTVNSDTKITASITMNHYATTGSRDVAVTTPAGTRTLAAAFTVIQAPPTVTRVSIKHGYLGQTLYVQIYGDYFIGSTSVSFGTGITVQTTSIWTPVWITTKISVASYATPGLRNISVTTPGGTGTLADSFTVESTSVSVKVALPSGGENWEVGTYHTITWTSSVITGGVSIQVSRDGGATWKTLVVSTANDGFYPWKVTWAPTNEARIKVLSTNSQNIFDMSDTNFIISAPTIKLTFPEGGESLKVGTKQTITWTTSPGFTGRVDIQLSRDGGATWKTIVSSTSNDGAQAWKVNVPLTDQAKIRVLSKSNRAIFDVSDTNFIIHAGTILVSSPNGGEVWQVGTTQTISWISNDVIGKIKIQLSRDGGENWTTIISSTANDGNQVWKVMGSVTNQARIRVLSKSYPTVLSLSDSFTISR